MGTWSTERLLVALEGFTLSVVTHYGETYISIPFAYREDIRISNVENDPPGWAYMVEHATFGEPTRDDDGGGGSTDVELAAADDEMLVAAVVRAFIARREEELAAIEAEIESSMGAA